MTTQTVSLCGLGNMGSAIADRLLPLPHLRGFDRDSGRRAAAAARGVSVVNGLNDLVPTDFLVLSLPVPAVSRLVVEQLSPRLSNESVVIETSTVNPDDMRALQQILAPSGASLLDAAILSGVDGMRSGSSTLLVGGDEDTVERARPVLSLMSGAVNHVGPLTTGMAAKVINNGVAHSVMVVLVEALSLARASGIAPTELIGLLSDREGGLIRPLTHRIAERVVNGNFDGGMPTEAARKDSTLALALAQSVQVPLFAMQATHTVYEMAIAEGLARYDYASIATMWEKWLGDSSHTGGTER
jgi:3-hydroxyisobutyrate dehydrogenase